ncbi:hypothetical protein AX17_003504 [Amanita inopinata Kibby_2008]|nr:hypothetical protein AX17_003504 [Amanita inopinata Kibby_2008]
MSAGTNTKSKAKRWVHNLLHPLADDKQPLHSHQQTLVHPSICADHNLTQTFNGLSLTEGTMKPDFIGGFHPSLATTRLNLNGGSTLPQPPASSAQSSPDALPCPPAMPIPHLDRMEGYSKTMQYALSNQNFIGHRPSQNVDVPTSSTSSNQKDVPVSLPSTPNKPKDACANSKRNRASSLTLAGKQAHVQCAAFTKAGKTCARQIKIGYPLTASGRDGGVQELELMPRYCFQHTKDINAATGFYARKNGIWIDYKNWIPDHLQSDTQAALRTEMERAHSQNDTPGYIYTFEIRGDDCMFIDKVATYSCSHVRHPLPQNPTTRVLSSSRLGALPIMLGD